LPDSFIQVKRNYKEISMIKESSSINIFSAIDAEKIYSSSKALSYGRRVKSGKLTGDKFFNKIAGIAEEDDGNFHAYGACEYQGPEKVGKRAFPQKAQHKDIDLVHQTRHLDSKISHP
jgi:hypothetical protein